MRGLALAVMRVAPRCEPALGLGLQQVRDDVVSGRLFVRYGRGGAFARFALRFDTRRPTRRWSPLSAFRV
jgi:hypothetical protein